MYSSRAYRAVRERLGLVTATLAEDIAGIRVVQSFTRERANEKIFRGVNESYREANHVTVVTNGLYFPFVDLLSQWKNTDYHTWLRAEAPDDFVHPNAKGHDVAARSVLAWFESAKVLP